LKYLLDTCVISELVRKRPEAAVLEWLRAQDDRMMALSVLTIGEIEKGIAKLPSGARRKQLQTWVDRDLTERFYGRLLPISVDVAVQWGKLSGETEKRGLRVPVVDGLLAATAQIHGLTIVTRNTADFTAADVALVNPWTSGVSARARR
jgi:predicted nucleic acid-binding protein